MTDKKEIKLQLVKVHKLDPKKIYLIQLHQKQTTMAEMKDLQYALRELGIKGMFIIQRGENALTINEISADNASKLLKDAKINE